jgi:LPXTG-motif cell wall-anchored protein
VTNPPRRPLPRLLAAAVAALALSLVPALPASAAPVVSEVPDGIFIGAIIEYDGLLYTGDGVNLRTFDGTTFTTVPGAPSAPQAFVEYLGDLWMLAGSTSDPTLWQFDGTTFTEWVDAAGQPVVIGGRLYFVAVDPVTSGRSLGWIDGTTMTIPPASPSNVSEIALGPTGGVVFTATTARTLWTFDGSATFTELPAPAAPVDVNELTLIGSRLFLDGEETAGGDNTAFTWDGTAFTKLGASGGGAKDSGCFLEYAGALYYGADDGTRRMFTADPAVAGSETAVVPSIPGGCPRYVATDGTFYLQAQGTGANPTLHTWDGTTLTELDSVGSGPSDFVEYGGKIYFVAQPVSETPALFVLEDVTAPVVPAAPTLPNTGATVSWWLIGVAALLVGGGVGILAFRGRRRRA